jgi:hypothetical protein
MDGVIEALGENSAIFMIGTLVIATTIACYFGATYILKRSSLLGVKDRDILIAIYNAGGGSSWDVKYSENWCKSDNKLADWAGIEAGFSNGHEHALELIMRGNKKFTGTCSMYCYISISTVIVNANTIYFRCVP